MYKLFASLLLFTTTLALPQVSCIAGTCYPNVRYGQPMYNDWAQHEVEKWKNAEEERRKNNEKHLRDLPNTSIPVEEAEVARTADDLNMKLRAGVYICEDIAWGGTCTHKYSPVGSDPKDCTVIDGRASSIGPDLGFSCIFYTNALCSAILSDGSDSLTLTYPGTDNLGSTKKGNFNDRILSYQCFKDDGSVEIDPDNERNTGVEVGME